MRYVSALVCVCVCLMSVEASAQVRGKTGIGLGAATNANGLSGKMYLGDVASLQAVAGGYLESAGGTTVAGLGLGIDALIEMPALVDFGGLEIAWALGLGAGAGIGTNLLRVGASGIVGLEFNFTFIEPLPFDLVAEWRPTLNILPIGLSLVNFTGHLRVYLF